MDFKAVFTGLLKLSLVDMEDTALETIKGLAATLTEVEIKQEVTEQVLGLTSI